LKKAILIFFLLSTSSFFAQQNDEYALKPPRDYSKNPAKTATFIELGGNAGLYSLNIDRIYLYKENVKLSARAGFSPTFNGIYIEQNYVLENNFIFFSGTHHLEVGLGATIQRRYNEKPNQIDHYFWENIFYSVWRCGYRFQKQDDGFFLRAAITPVIMKNDAEGFHSNYFQFWAGVGVGVSF
jgi:hypothetical protein